MEIYTSQDGRIEASEMNENTLHQTILAPQGSIEPHANLLKIPSDNQLLYKMMTVENLLRSIASNYLHFNRVDSYPLDSIGVDLHDGQQLPKDQKTNARVRFKNATNFSAADYYEISRARTYACCFSLENSDLIWNNYANDNVKGKVCIVFELGKLRSMLNKLLQSDDAILNYNSNQCLQIFSLNYGKIEYVEWEKHHANKEYLVNPIIYTYLKDITFSEEKEFRISLSAIGIGQFALKNGSLIQFPSSLQLSFDFKAAIEESVIQQILYAPGSNSDILQVELFKLGIMVKKG